MSERTYEEFNHKKVNLTHVKNGEEVTETGLVEVANVRAVMFRPRGKSDSNLIMNFDIKAIEEVEATASAAPAKIVCKRVNPVPANQVKRHLVNAHGWLISAVTPMSDEQAVIDHEKLHESFGQDYGHYHAEAPKAVQTEAPEAA